MTVGPHEPGRVFVVGSVNLDVSIRCQRLPAAGETVLGTDIDEQPGGKGLNQAVAAATVVRPIGGGSSRVAVHLVGAVGADASGVALRRFLSDVGVGSDHLATVDAFDTGRAFVAVDANGENQILVVPGANRELSPGGVAAALATVGPRDVVVCSLEIGREAAMSALDAARAGRATSVLNPSPVDGVDGAMLASADLVVANESETEALRDVLGLEGVWPACVVTAGAKGAWVVPPGQHPRPTSSGWPGQHVAAPGNARPVVDTAGAGDCLLGVLAAALADGTPLLGATRAGVAAATDHVRTPGACAAPAPADWRRDPAR